MRAESGRKALGSGLRRSLTARLHWRARFVLSQFAAWEAGGVGVADPSFTDSETEARRNGSPVQSPKQELEPPFSGCDPLVALTGRDLQHWNGMQRKTRYPCPCTCLP